MPVQHVGRPLKRLEDPKLITGRDPFVNDVRLEGALTLAFVRSPHAHAVLTSIDTRAARALPGVVAVLTGAGVNPEIGEQFLGTVVKIIPSGAFISLLPGKDGRMHVTQIRKLW